MILRYQCAKSWIEIYRFNIEFSEKHSLHRYMQIMELGNESI